MPNFNQPSWGAQSNFANYQQTGTAQAYPNSFQQPQMMPQRQSPVMSIAPVSGFDNMLQFPVAAGTDLFLIDLNEMKLYRKNNPMNPREYDEFDLQRIVKEPQQPDTVTRSEFDEMKAMMTQMMGMLQSKEQRPPQENQNYNGKRGRNNDRSNGNAANNG